LAIELWPIARPQPYAKNARTVTARAIDSVAASLQEFGWRQPIVVDAKDVIVAGHKRLLAAQKLGMTEVPVHVAAGLTAAQCKAYRLMDNRSNQNSEWDMELLQSEMQEMVGKIDLSLTGFEAEEIRRMLEESSAADPDASPDPPAAPVSRTGDLWQLEGHRALCGDSTKPADVARLAEGAVSCLLHADPPYGMGKEAVGVENDNLNQADLATFQMLWWAAYRPFLTANASVYVWGSPAGLWRLWYSGGLQASERMTLRNEIVWDKGAGRGQNSDEMRSYAVMTERCLFFMLGEQGFGNTNMEDYWEGFEPIRGWMEQQAGLMKWGPRDVRRITGVGMFSHWFSKSQWVMIPEVHYAKLQAAANGNAFKRPYAKLRALYDGGLADDGHLAAKQEFYGTRAFFDNTHDNMNEIWSFPPVLGEERQGHATPKPVDLIARAVKSSAPAGEVVLEPFGGSGSTLIACEKSGRRCYSMELDPGYVDVVVMRWEKFTGKKATLGGRTFEQVAADRAKGKK
jgi:DNA modification methylase